MPRTVHLGDINPNRIYAIDAQLLYMHETPRMTTAIIEQENVQSRIKIPRRMMIEEGENDLVEGCNYHFGFCYINPNGWISVRHPENNINRIEEEGDPHIKLMSLSEIANNCENLTGHYLSSVLQVISVNPEQKIIKGDKELTLCVLKCYSSGYIVDVNLWNHDLPLQDLVSKWMVFSGFKLKKIGQWKFMLVSSVYSKIAAYEGQVQSMPYLATQRYHNLSSVYEQRNIQQLNLLLFNNDKVFSQITANLTKMQSFTYEGCSECHKKVEAEVGCGCSPNYRPQIFTIMKIFLESENGNLQGTVFSEQVQRRLSEIKEPLRVKVHIKSVKRLNNPETEQLVHIITKIFV